MPNSLFQFDLKSVKTYVRVFIFFGLAIVYLKHTLQLAEQRRIFHQLEQNRRIENQD